MRQAQCRSGELHVVSVLEFILSPINTIVVLYWIDILIQCRSEEYHEKVVTTIVEWYASLLLKRWTHELRNDGML